MFLRLVTSLATQYIAQAGLRLRTLLLPLSLDLEAVDYTIAFHVEHLKWNVTHTVASHSYSGLLILGSFVMVFISNYGSALFYGMVTGRLVH